MKKILRVMFQVIPFARRKMMTTNLAMVDGGLCGGRVHIAWCSPRQRSFTKSISTFIQTRCHHQLENM